MPGFPGSGLIICGVLVLFAILTAGCGAFVDNEESEPADKIADEDGDGPDDTRAADADASEPTCALVGTDVYGDMQVELTFTNTVGSVPNLVVNYALSDGEGGTRFLEELAGATLPRMNEKFRIQVDTHEDVPSNVDEDTISCEVSSVAKAIHMDGFEFATDAETCEIREIDSSGGFRAEVVGTSPFPDAEDPQILWALEGPGPVRFDTGAERMNTAGAGEIVLTSQDIYTEKPAWIGDDEVTCSVLGYYEGY